MPERVQKEARVERTAEEGTEVGPVAVKAATTEINNEEIDKLLDEIDNVLEKNAEEFVNAFRQKGGQ